MEKKKYRVSVEFCAVVEADEQADALYSVGGALRYGFEPKNIEKVHVSVLYEISDPRTPAPTALNLEDAPPAPEVANQLKQYTDFRGTEASQPPTEYVHDLPATPEADPF